MTFEERLAALGVDLSDILRPDGYKLKTMQDYYADIIDRMETRIINLTGERDYLLRLYGFDCEECKRYDECNRDGDYCERELVEDWAGVPEDWRADDEQS